VQENAPSKSKNFPKLDPIDIAMITVSITIIALQRFFIHCLFLVFSHPLNKYPSMMIFAGYITSGYENNKLKQNTTYINDFITRLYVGYVVMI
jgi:hypothetical protein